MKWNWRKCLLSVGCVVWLPGIMARAQDNYEIQVYGSETVAPKTTMVEMHSNFTVDGFKAVPGSRYQNDGERPTNHAEHQTIEITQGITKWAEVGFYIFTSERNGQGIQWVGDHIRRAPESWHLPVGLSISNEIGYKRARFSPDTWTWEIRPIIDKQVGRYYLSLNPTMERAWHGPGVKDGVAFSPNVKVGYDFTKKVQAGVEYYAAYGNLRGFDTLHDQQQQFFLATDLNVSPKWEFNFGVGVGTTASTDHLIVKTIVGRRFDWGPPCRDAQAKEKRLGKRQVPLTSWLRLCGPWGWSPDTLRQGNLDCGAGNGAVIRHRFFASVSRVHA